MGVLAESGLTSSSVQARYRGPGESVFVSGAARQIRETVVWDTLVTFAVDRLGIWITLDQHAAPGHTTAIC